VLEQPSSDAAPCSRLECGAYVKAEELRANGRWLKLAPQDEVGSLHEGGHTGQKIIAPTLLGVHKAHSVYLCQPFLLVP
jgi:hypothetical protein